MITFVEFHSEAGEIQLIFASKWTPKRFYDGETIRVRSVKLGTFLQHEQNEKLYHRLLS